MDLSGILLYLDSVPLPLFIAAVALLPILFVPTSLLWIATGLIHGFWVGFLVIVMSATLNFALVYLVARKWLRPYILRQLHSRGYTNVRLKSHNAWRLTFAIRLMPATPQILQSYCLSLTDVPFRVYIIGSLGAQLLYASAFLLLGEAMLDSNIRLIFAAVTVIICLRIVFSHYAKRTDSTS